MIIWQLIFWICIILFLHSYLLYPFILQIISAKKKNVSSSVEPMTDLPSVTVVMSLYNEEEILQAKLDSILSSHYPSEKLNILAGSDCSSDNTNQILEEYAKKHPNINYHIFNERTGKPGAINHLVKQVHDNILIMTDANVIFTRDTISRLVDHFKDPDVGIVGGNVIIEGIRKDGVSIQEKAYMSREIMMKHREGLIWNATIGVDGAIYAIRKELYTPVPAGFSVDDFFISMSVLKQGYVVKMDIDAICYEDVPNLISEEYRRKVRIASGNIQNLRYFSRLLLTPFKGASFAFISHKLLRWMGPFLIIGIMLSNTMLYNHHPFYNFSFYGMIAVLSLPIIDFFLGKLGIHIVFLRFIRHFITMNIALFHGFINNIRGIKKDVWQPTRREKISA